MESITPLEGDTEGCRMREMFSERPYMYGIVAVVIGVAVSSVSVVVEGR